MQAEWFSFELGGWTDSSSNEKVMELSAPLRDGSLGFCMHGIAGTLKVKIKKASIVRQQKIIGQLLLWIISKSLVFGLFS